MGPLLTLLRQGASSLDALLLALALFLPISSFLPQPIVGLVALGLSIIALSLWLSLRMAAPAPAPISGWAWLAAPLSLLVFGVVSILPGLPGALGIGTLGVNDALAAGLKEALGPEGARFLDPWFTHRAPWVGALFGALALGIIARDRLRSFRARRNLEWALLGGGCLLAIAATALGVSQGNLGPSVLMALLTLGATLLALAVEGLMVKRGGRPEGGLLPGVASAGGVGCLALGGAFIGDAYHYLWAVGLGMLPFGWLALRHKALAWGIVLAGGLTLGGAASLWPVQRGLMGAFQGQMALSTWPLGLPVAALAGVLWLSLWGGILRGRGESVGVGLMPGCALVSVGGALALTSHSPLPMGCILLIALGGALALGGMQEEDKAHFEPTLLWGSPPALAYVPLILLGPLGGAILGLSLYNALPEGSELSEGDIIPALRKDARDGAALAYFTASNPTPLTCTLPWDPQDDAPWLACIEAGITEGWEHPSPPQLLAYGLAWPKVSQRRVDAALILLKAHPELVGPNGVPQLPVAAALALGSGSSGLPFETRLALLLSPHLPASRPSGDPSPWAFSLRTDGGGVLSPPLAHPPQRAPSRSELEALGEALLGYIPASGAMGGLLQLHALLPQSPALTEACALGLGMLGRPGEGLALLNSAQAKSPSLSALGLSLQAQGGECEDAIEGARSLGEVHLSDPKLQLRLANVYERCGERVLWVVSLERAKESQPKDAALRVRLGDAYKGTRQDDLYGKRGHIFKACIEEIEGNGPCCRAYVALGGKVEVLGEGDGRCVLAP